jgi:TolB-like protein/Flp pilus assembly protein TadD
MSAVWPDTFVEESNLSSNISILRKQLGVTPDGGDYIQTIPKRGYRFAAAVKQVQNEPPILLIGQDVGSGSAPAVESESNGAGQPAGPHEAATAGMTTAARVNKRAARPGVLPAAAAVLLVLVLTPLYLAGRHWRLPGSGVEAHIDAIAVLPLENLSGDPAQEYFADGMTEALTADLAQIGALRVIARASMMQYKETKQPLAQIAQRLKVEAVVSGSVLRSGDRVRITAVLIRAATGQQLWAKTYERSLGRPGSGKRSGSGCRRGAGESYGAGADTHGAQPFSQRRRLRRYYLKGRYYYNRFTVDGFSKSIEYFEQAIEPDSEYAAAYAGLADALASLEQIGAARHEDVHPQALEAASKALAMDDTLPEAHAAMASVRANDWERSAAEREARKAIELNPGFPLAHLYYSNMLRHLGGGKKASRKPDARSSWTRFPTDQRRAGGCPLSARQYDAAIEQYQKTLELYPNQAAPRDSLRWAYVYEGKYQQGMEEIRKSIALYGDDASLSPEIAFVSCMTGRKGEAQKILNQLLSRSKTVPIAAHHFALIYVGMGNKDKAFAWLEKSYEQHSPMMAWLEVDQRFDSLRGEPRFQDLMRRVGLI